MHVKLLPKSQRAKNRIQEHGEIMLLKKQKMDGSFYVESLNKSFKLCEGMAITWAGWFKKEEAEFKFIDQSS